MARRGPGDWPLPPRRHRPDRQAGFGCETAKKARAQDKKRAGLIQGNRSLARREAGRLAKALKSPTSFHRSLASMRYLRKRRLAINGHLGWLIKRVTEPLTFSTLLPRGWLIPADHLGDVNPRKLLAQIRAVLIRAGASNSDGWAFFVLDCEYIEHLDAFAFHLHGVSMGAISIVIGSLRERRKFQWQPGAHGLGKRPVQMKRVNPGEEARTVNYLIKTFHGKRVYREEDGELVRTGQKVAIPGPRHSEYLLWLSRWRIADFVLSIHLSFGRNRLLVSSDNVQSRDTSGG